MSHLLSEDSTLIDMLCQMASGQAEKVAPTFSSGRENEDDSLTYPLDRYACASAVLLRSCLDQPGERVLLLYPPGLECIGVFLSCLCARIVALWCYPACFNRPGPHLGTVAQDTHASITQVISRIRNTCQVELPLDVQFKRQTIAEIAEYLDDVWMVQGIKASSGSAQADRDEGEL